MTETFLSVTIGSDPSVYHDAYGSQYTNYKINSITDDSRFSARVFSSNRRFSDFCWLHNLLCNDFPGAIIPPLPEKLTVGRFNPEFIEQRRRGLELFLKRVIGHSEYPEFINCAYFKTFLESDEETFTKIKESFRSDIKYHNVMGIVQNATSFLGPDASMLSNKTGLDLKLAGLLTYFNQMETNLLNVSRQAAILAKREHEKAQGLTDVGLSLFQLGSDGGESLGSAIEKLSLHMTKVSTVSAQAIEKFRNDVEVPAMDVSRYICSARAAFHTRAMCVAAHSNAIAALETARTALDKYPSKDEAVRIVRSNAHERAMLDSMATARELEKASKRAEIDFGRLNHWLVSTVRSIMLAIISQQVDLGRETVNAFTTAASVMQAVRVPDPHLCVPADPNSNISQPPALTCFSPVLSQDSSNGVCAAALDEESSKDFGFGVMAISEYEIARPVVL